MRVLPFKIQISKIESNLFLGSIEDAYDVKKLSSLGITHVLNMATEIPNFYENRFSYKKINGRDIPSFQMHRHFDDVADFIHENSLKGKVFVHCFCGISRSTTAIIAYMVKHKGIEPKKAYEVIRKKRWIVYPNDGFEPSCRRDVLAFSRARFVLSSFSGGKCGSVAAILSGIRLSAACHQHSRGYLHCRDRLVEGLVGADGRPTGGRSAAGPRLRVAHRSRRAHPVPLFK